MWQIRKIDRVIRKTVNQVENQENSIKIGRLGISVKVSDDNKSAIFELLLDQVFQAIYPYLKPHILFYSNGLAIWHSLPDITHINFDNGFKSAILIFQCISLPETAHFFL